MEVEHILTVHEKVTDVVYLILQLLDIEVSDKQLIHLHPHISQLAGKTWEVLSMREVEHAFTYLRRHHFLSEILHL